MCSPPWLSWPTCSPGAHVPKACQRNPGGWAITMHPDNRRVLCLITDRRRLLAAVGQPEKAWPTLILAQVRGAIRGGVDVVQIRERDADAGVLAELVKHCERASRGTSVRVLVNDRLDIAIATAAHGAHLPEDSVSPAVARKITGPTFVLGRSVHSSEAARSSGPVDYLLAGSVFETFSKPGAPPRLGLDGFRAVVVAAGGRPVWAIGGVTAERISSLVAQGASGVAAIGALLPRSTTADVAADVQKATETLRFAFDSSGGLS